KLLPERLKELSGRMNENFEIRDNNGERVKEPFSYNAVFIKNNRSNWGSCSGKRNINLNLHLVALPNELMDFVIIHELCHLVHLNHSKEFHKLLDAACGNREKELNKKLRHYKLS
ncbi:MAG: M48 family metallopeptidase, partial [Bacteroidales bacterium]|nr:M48 family metallopeptidase [Bacteroidales bacterium]